MMQLDDLSGEVDQVNLPGSVDEYPNWRRKLSMTIEQMADDPRACAPDEHDVGCPPGADRWQWRQENSQRTFNGLRPAHDGDAVGEPR